MTFDDIWWRLMTFDRVDRQSVTRFERLLCAVQYWVPSSRGDASPQISWGRGWCMAGLGQGHMRITWESHDNHMTVQDAQDVQDIARCQKVSSAFFSFFLWICWTIWTWSPHQEMRFANSGLEWIDHTRRLLAIENVCLDRSSLAKLMTSHQTSKIGRPRQSQKSIEKLAMQQEGTIVE